jgi:hypothetical protein
MIDEKRAMLDNEVRWMAMPGEGIYGPGLTEYERHNKYLRSGCSSYTL